MRRTPLAWRNLAHNKVTLLISAAAVAFAVLIMFMEVGFLNGLYDSQAGALQSLEADLVMVSRSLHIFNTHETFPLVRLEQAAGLIGVKGAYPIYMEDLASDLRNPAIILSSRNPLIVEVEIWRPAVKRASICVAQARDKIGRASCRERV